MKKFFLATTLAVSTALGGCAGMTPQDLIAQVSGYEATVQADANLICGFVPTAATIIAMIPGAGTVAPEAAAVAEAICAAIATAPTPAASARFKSLGSGIAVNVATVNVPGVGRVSISGTFTR